MLRATSEGLEGTEEHGIGNRREGGSFYIVTGSLAELYPTVIWKTTYK